MKNPKPFAPTKETFGRVVPANIVGRGFFVAEENELDAWFDAEKRGM